jgi:predicted metalloprotease with PDZ domain
MKKTLSCLLLSFALAGMAPLQAQEKGEVLYEINLNDRADDLFKVKLAVKKLKEENNIFQFAATAPGTYQTMDIGRFVRSFKALDKKGREIAVEKINANQWEISKPKKVRSIEYTIAETFDTPVAENHIYEMCGTSIENDHVLINGQAVFGYFSNMQEADLRIKLFHPQEWLAGTALPKDEEGYYLATDFDHIVDSPILLGRLSKASSDFNGTTIDIYTYSKTDKIKSADLMENMNSMLQAANDFVVTFPVDRYTFLYHFEDKSAGAWEHSYSSGYVLQEAELTPAFAQKVTDIAAHEFFHIITPLNIHSELIETFNFVTPTASEHLWMYEGVTEWASHIMQLRSKLTTPEEYFQEQSQKLMVDEKYFDTTYSLSQLSLNCFTPEGQRQYGNIYYRGALVASLLDIRLLELSEGKRGLREVVNELSKTYGPEKAFPEADFFNVFTKATYPEIGEFLNNYVKQANPLPVKEYFAKLGVQYDKALTTGQQTTSLGFGVMPQEEQFIIQQPDAAVQELGLQAGDALVAVNGEKIAKENFMAIATKLQDMPVGEAYQLQVKRGDELVDIAMKIQGKAEVKPHHFSFMPDTKPEQLNLRTAWMQNL